jgi:hypothetical protein
MESVKKRLQEIIDEALLQIDVDMAQNKELRRAIHIVESFLHKSGRVCYGGQAINAHLPPKYQFYDSEKELPDYDFFTPDAKTDCNLLIEDLREAGFTEISKRVGIHDGTIKIYVNYTPIADITQMDPEFYDIIFKNSSILRNIHYADPLFLKMLMFIELSRPRGQVKRWVKVFERLYLLSDAYPLPKCSNKFLTIVESKESISARSIFINYMIKNNYVYLGPDLFYIYSPMRKYDNTKNKKGLINFLLRGKSPVVFLSPDAKKDSEELMKLTNSQQRDYYGFHQMLPAMIILTKNSYIICIIVQEEACHSTITLPITEGRKLRIASLDTLLTFMIGLYYRDETFLMSRQSLMCWIHEYMELMTHYAFKPKKMFPTFSLECSGYQTSFASLLRAKAERIKSEREKITRKSSKTIGALNSNIKLTKTRKLKKNT